MHNSSSIDNYRWNHCFSLQLPTIQPLRKGWYRRKYRLTHCPCSTWKIVANPLRHEPLTQLHWQRLNRPRKTLDENALMDGHALLRSADMPRPIRRCAKVHRSDPSRCDLRLAFHRLIGLETGQMFLRLSEPIPCTKASDQAPRRKPRE